MWKGTYCLYIIDNDALIVYYPSLEFMVDHRQNQKLKKKLSMVNCTAIMPCQYFRKLKQISREIISFYK